MKIAEIINESREENFKRWFGRSRVVDGSGQPLKVYHGTSGDFAQFSRIDGGNAYGPGYYFTKDPSEASGYADGTGGGRMAPGGEASPNVMAVYLKAENIFTLDKRVLTKSEIGSLESASNKLNPGSWQKGELAKMFDRGYPPTAINVVQYIANQAGGKYTDIVRAAGYDALEGSYGIVVFSPTQVKSAIGNNGNFDPTNPDITKENRE